MINAEVICDSLNSDGSHRLTTFLLTYPRFIHSEFMTHRMLSRNAASSRAIPTMKMLRGIWNEPAMPVSWGRNGKGMQAGEELSGWQKWLAIKIWKLAGKVACGFSWSLHKLGVHKQLANRITEPWAHITVVASATDWGNFFALRTRSDAQPEFQCLAKKMLKAYRSSPPKPLRRGEWHLPFADKHRPDGDIKEQIIVSAARCARTSYLNFDGDYVFEKDLGLYGGLSGKGHMSPFEHQAKSGDKDTKSGNFNGFHQHRKDFPNECLS